MNTEKKKYNLPDGYSFFQTALKSVEFLNDPIKFISKSMEVYSDSYTASLKRNKKIIITQNPEFINYILKENHKNFKKSKLSTESAARFFGKGLLFSNGEYWLRQRRLIQPAFHKEKLQGLNTIIIKSIDNSLIKFPAGENIDICPIVHRLSFNILIKSLFDINLSSRIMDEISEIFSDLLEFLIKDTNQPFRRLLYPVTLEKNDCFKKAKRLREIIGDIVRERKSETRHYSDLLDMLLNSKYEDSGASLSDEQIIDELLIIIFAGHETTANSISWLLYLLSTNTEKLQKLTAVLNEINILESVNNEYVRACISEGMRLYPAAWMTERVSINDDQFGEFTFPKNTIIILFFFGLHRDKNLWEEELQFKPERFIADPTIFKSKNYFPFGAGPRMCIGNNFALTEMSFFLHLFLNKFEIKATGQMPEMKPLITLRPDEIILSVRPRSKREELTS
jgi:cytochrome P450